MGAKVKSRKSESIPVFDMKDGDVAEIVDWGDQGEYVGRVVQRVGNRLISIGFDGDEIFSTVLETSNEYLRVHLLRSGDTIELT